MAATVAQPGGGGLMGEGRQWLGTGGGRGPAERAPVWSEAASINVNVSVWL